jgi:hypothetical protein
MHDIKASKTYINDESNYKIDRKSQLSESLNSECYKDLDFGVFHDIGGPEKSDSMQKAENDVM